jgi:protein-disulfide isomerase
VRGTEPQIRDVYVKTGQLKIVFYPIVDFGDPSLQAHQAADCAGEQGKFWVLHDLMKERQQELFASGEVRQTLQSMAAEVGVEPASFNSCLDEQRYASLVSKLDEQRRQRGLRTRPTFDINGQLLVGAQGFEAFQEVIEPLLKR